ncbi:hypothetical protein GIB67_038258 [Kingdonia uniflora]|uniref:Ubiquitin fusion degradation protein UFD1 N-terminal subdomain 2 domain-containing protein n=1 Tax=Kingdonia uniflora TaxID=39325 RepID=A0A7J7MSP6_9MAGN|nr:hypothetical protein GIB67_038258 [Kingdonia uniflora]
MVGVLRSKAAVNYGRLLVAYNNKKYYIDIVESKPAHAISIIETDCEVDFAPPLDYKEPERLAAYVVSSKEPAQVQEAPVDEEPNFIPFTAVGKRLDGKPMHQSPSSVTSPSGLKDKQPTAANGGKLIFGSNANQAPKEAQKIPAKETKQEQLEKKEEPKFQAFSQKKYTLKGRADT